MGRRKKEVDVEVEGTTPEVFVVEQAAEKVTVAWDQDEQAVKQDPEYRIVRHTQIFSDEINDETVQELINAMNNYIEIDLFISTPGGSKSAMDALIHYLNGRKQDIVIYLTDMIASAGTFLLLYFEGELHITENLDFILFHSIDRMMYTTRKDDVNKKQLLKQLKRLNNEMLFRLADLGLTDKEIKKIIKGRDVIYYRKDFHKLFGSV